MKGVRPNRLLLSNLSLGNRRSVNSTFLCALLVIASLALPANALAGASESSRQPRTSAEFTVAGTNGYSLYVKSENGTVGVAVANQLPLVSTISADGRIRPANTGNAATSTYVTGSPQDPNVIEADYGSLGMISVAFQPSGESRLTTVTLEDQTGKCIGRERIVRHLGTFTGTIKFQGEGGYTTVDLPSARGTVGTSTFRDCTTKRIARRGGSRTSSSRGTVFLTDTRGRESFFVASAGSHSSSAEFFAFIPELISERVIVVRSAQAVAPAKRSFAFNDALSSARLTPPAPFSGVGHFRKVRGAPSTWTGSLSVAFPGKTVPLTGPPFHANLRHSK